MYVVDYVWRLVMIIVVILCLAAGFAIGDIISSVIAGTDLVIVSVIKKIKAAIKK